MRKQILTLLTLTLAAGSALPQSRLSVNNLQIVRSGERVEVSFEATGEIEPFNINTTYTFTPCITGTGGRAPLSPVIFASRRSRILNERRGIATDRFYHKGDTVLYRCSVPYETWMADGKFTVEATLKGCCRTELTQPYLLAGHILPTPVVANPLIEPEVVAAPVAVASAGKRMSGKYPFVVPDSELTGKDGKPVLDFALPLDMGRATTREGRKSIGDYLSRSMEEALKVDFKLSGTTLDPMFGMNAEQLAQLLEAVSTIESSSDSRITHVVIAGFASPEGVPRENEQLAWKRALALGEFLLRNTKLDAGRIHLYNGGNNWEGLRKLVAQGDMKHRDQVLGIIDNVSVTGERKKKLMDLAIGNPYRYMMEHYFPQLRYAACIRVYYEQTTTETSSK